jgi:FixJ family two-component response regulator
MTADRPVVFVVDDDERVRDALSSLLTSAGLEVAVFASATEFLEADKPDAPACLVLDLELPDIHGLELQKELAEREAPPIVFITGYGDIPSSVKAMKAGAVESLNDRYERLTPREREVLTFVVAGCANKVTAGELGTSEITIGVHRGQIMRKMGARSLAELVRLADKLGIRPSPQEPLNKPIASRADAQCVRCGACKRVRSDAAIECGRRNGRRRSSCSRVRQNVLESAGYEAVSFESAETFLLSGALSSVSCVIADVRLPGMDGTELQRRIRRERRQLPVILITAHDDDDLRQRALRDAATAFLLKPFDGGDLLEHVARATNAP